MPSLRATQSICDSAAKKSLRLARGAHLAAGKIIRVNARNGDARMLGAVTAARVRDPADNGAGSKSAVGAGVEISVHLVGDNRAVTFDAGFQLHNHRMPRRAGKKLFAILHHHLDWPATADSEQITNRLIDRRALAAEVAADRHRD